MEKDIIVEGFSQSIEKNGLIYKTVVGDGDSSVYKAILDRNPYRKYGIRVQKIECTNHLFRNMCNKIVDASKGRLTTSLARGNVKSFRDIVKKGAFKIRQHIVMLIKIRKNDPDNSQGIKNLQLQILNSIHHIFGNHSNCKKYKVPCEEKVQKNWIPTLKSTGMYQSIRRAVSDLSCHTQSLILTTTNNYVESFNAIVAKMIGGKRINHGMRDSYQVRIYAAVIQYNCQSLLTKINQDFGYDPSNIIIVMEEKQKKKIEAKKIMRTIQGRRKKHYANNGKADYGESANRPDIDPDSYQVLVEEHLKQLKEDQANRLEFERSTVTQGDSEKWHSKRTELLTASKFGKICRRKPSTSCSNLVKEILYPSVKDLPALTYGSEHEDESRKRLAKKLKKNIEIAGLLIDEKEKYLGASVGGLIDEDDIVELKNPISRAKLSISEALKNKKSIRRIFSNVMNEFSFIYLKNNYIKNKSNTQLGDEDPHIKKEGREKKRRSKEDDLTNR